MNLTESMYYFEHTLLPAWFFGEKKKFVIAALNDKTFLYRVCSDVLKNEEVANPYKAEDFVAEPAKITDELLMMRIIFPMPAEEPLCYCSYMFFDNDFKQISYYTIEKGDPKKGPLPHVAEWTVDGVHHKIGRCGFENMGDFKACVDAHKAKFGL